MVIATGFVMILYISLRNDVKEFKKASKDVTDEVNKSIEDDKKD